MKTSLMAGLALASAFPVAAQQAVIMVRHAELPGQAMATPKDMPLSEEGDARAQRLAATLKDAGIGAIYVTDFARSQLTAAPLAKALGLTPTVLPKGDAKDMVQRLSRDDGQRRVLLVGHTDTLPALLSAFGHAADVKIAAQDFGSIFVLVPQASGAPPQVLTLRY